MRLKSFTAKTMRDAMDMVRDTLGDDAVIVATREDGDTISITAAIDPDAMQHDNGSNHDWQYSDDHADDNAVEDDITDILLKHAVPEEVLDSLIANVAIEENKNIHHALSGALERSFRFKPLPVLPSPTPYMMVGMAGGGKTLAVAKMAARSVVAGLDVAVITTDGIRAGGKEQLEAFTSLMDIELLVADSAAQLCDYIDGLSHKDQIIIDTAGVNPFDDGQLRGLKSLIAPVKDICPVLVQPSYLNAEEAGEAAELFALVGVKHLLPTCLDSARRLGSILSSAHYGALTVTDCSATARVADGLITMDAKQLTQFLCPNQEEASHNVSKGFMVAEQEIQIKEDNSQSAIEQLLKIS